MEETLSPAEEYEATLEAAIERSPMEVTRFVFSDTFTRVVNAIAEICKLNQKQTDIAHKVLRDGMLGIMDQAESIRLFTEAGISKEQADKILDLAFEYCMSTVLYRMDTENLIEALVEEGKTPQETPVQEKQTPASDAAPADIVGGLLKKNSVTVPSTRNYSTDPYREQV